LVGEEEAVAVVAVEEAGVVEAVEAGVQAQAALPMQDKALKFPRCHI
jgi:hypothetical protein